MKYVRCDSHCKYPAYDKEEIDNLLSNLFPVGAIYTTSTNKNPSSNLGGTWELVGKNFRELGDDDEGTGSYVEINQNTVNEYSFYFTRSGTTITARLMIRNKTALTDDAINIGTILLDKLGVTRFYSGTYSHIGATDGGNAIIQLNVEYNTGSLEIVDVLARGENSATVTPNSQIFFDLVYNFKKEYMLDSACDKFYWKRTS